MGASSIKNAGIPLSFKTTSDDDISLAIGHLIPKYRVVSLHVMMFGYSYFLGKKTFEPFA